MVIPFNLGAEELLFIVLLIAISLIFAFARQYIGFGLVVMGILLMFKPNVGWIVGVTLGILCIVIGIALIVRKPKDIAPQAKLPARAQAKPKRK